MPRRDASGKFVKTVDEWTVLRKKIDYMYEMLLFSFVLVEGIYCAN